MKPIKKIREEHKCEYTSVYVLMAKWALLT